MVRFVPAGLSSFEHPLEVAYEIQLALEHDFQIIGANEHSSRELLILASAGVVVIGI